MKTHLNLFGIGDLVRLESNENRGMHPVRFRVTYGKQVHDGLNYGDAATELGACILHALACESWPAVPEERGGPVKMPGGSRRFSEVLFDLSMMAGAHFKDPRAQGPEDSRDVWCACVAWAEEFEEKNAGRDWSDGMYLEEVEAFGLAKLAEFAPLAP